MSHLTLIEPVPATDKILEKESGVRFVIDARGVTAGMIKGDSIHIRRTKLLIWKRVRVS